MRPCRALRKIANLKSDCVTVIDLLSLLHAKSENKVLNAHEKQHFNFSKFDCPNLILQIIQNHCKVQRVQKVKQLSGTFLLTQNLFSVPGQRGNTRFLTAGARALILSCPNNGKIWCKLCSTAVSPYHFMDNHLNLSLPVNIQISHIYDNELFLYTASGLVVSNVLTALLLFFKRKLLFNCNICENVQVSNLQDMAIHFLLHIGNFTLETYLERHLSDPGPGFFPKEFRTELNKIADRIREFLKPWNAPSIHHARDEILFGSEFSAMEFSDFSNSIPGILTLLRTDHPDSLEGSVQEIILNHINNLTVNPEISDPNRPRLTDYGRSKGKIDTPEIGSEKIIVLGSNTLIITGSSNMVNYPLPQRNSFKAIPVTSKLGLYINEISRNSASNVLLRMMQKYPDRIFLVEVPIYTEDGISIDIPSVIRQVRVIRKITELVKPKPLVIVAASFPPLTIETDFSPLFMVQEYYRGELFLSLECHRNNLNHLPLSPRIFPQFPDSRPEIVAVIPDFNSDTNITVEGSRILTEFLNKIAPELIDLTNSK